MATKDQVANFGVVLGDLVQQRTTFRPSVTLCNEFAMKVLAEARQAGEISWVGDPDAERDQLGDPDAS